MSKTTYATPFAIIMAGLMVSASIYLAAGRLSEEAGPIAAELTRKTPSGEPKVDSFAPIQIDGWAGPENVVDGVWSKDDMRSLLDAWHSHWFDENGQPRRDW